VYRRDVDRARTAIYCLTFTVPVGGCLAAVSIWNFWAGMAAITIAVTAALVVRSD
jgi:hypothetical protein